MNGIDYFIIALVVAILGGVIFYIYRAKKQGVKCIGCPDAKTCSGNCSGCNGSCGGCSAEK